MSIQAQQKNTPPRSIADSIREKMLDEYASRYPLLRQGFIGTDFLAKGNIKAKFQDQDIFKGDAKIVRIRSNFNIPVSQWGKNRLTGAISYTQQRFQGENIYVYPGNQSGLSGDENKAAVGLSMFYSRADSIFGHPVNLSAGLSGTTDEMSSIKRITYTGTITVPVKRTQISSLSLGAVVIIDRANRVPVIPIVSYWRKYEQSDLELFVDLPSRIALRKQLSKRSWVLGGSEIANSFAFFNSSQPFIPQNAIMTTLDIKTNLTFEYLVTKKLILGVNGGLFSNVQARMFESDKKADDYFFETSNGTVPYIGFTVSFLPFLKALK